MYFKMIDAFRKMTYLATLDGNNSEERRILSLRFKDSIIEFEKYFNDWKRKCAETQKWENF